MDADLDYIRYKDKELINRILKGGDITPRDTGSDNDPNPKEMTIREIEMILGYSIKIVK